LPFGVRKTPNPIPADGEFYACPLCIYNTTDKNTMINHLETFHNLKKKDAKALVEAT
jgi:hypothetical protein